ncbi:hypothetical protein [Pedosphaera parvula]|uniref:hypothetical protein n=1 Tax=Pedosphaera parvula TaxID=1032527 RepID=UPI00123750F0|nr:hypothetical protein [Pedosphaera parvula]
MSLLVVLGFKAIQASTRLPNDLSVVFVGFTNNPTGTFRPIRVIIPPTGATGLCALFRVGNVGSNRFIAFETIAGEQKTERGWEPFQVSGVGGSVWTPGYSCLYAVPWPTGVPTNATWRLQLRWNREASRWGKAINLKLRRELFHDSKYYHATSSEVIP